MTETVKSAPSVTETEQSALTVTETVQSALNLTDSILTGAAQPTPNVTNSLGAASNESGMSKNSGIYFIKKKLFLLFALFITESRVLL